MEKSVGQREINFHGLKTDAYFILQEPDLVIIYDMNGKYFINL